MTIQTAPNNKAAKEVLTIVLLCNIFFLLDCLAIGAKTVNEYAFGLYGEAMCLLDVRSKFLHVFAIYMKDAVAASAM